MTIRCYLDAMQKPSLFTRLVGSASRPPSRPARSDVSSGALFRRRPEYGPVEYAEVIDVATDPSGIRHVRFQLAFAYRDKTLDAGERTLSAGAFATRFNERIDRGAAGDEARVGRGGG